MIALIVLEIRKVWPKVTIIGRVMYATIKAAINGARISDRYRHTAHNDANRTANTRDL